MTTEAEQRHGHFDGRRARMRPVRSTGAASPAFRRAPVPHHERARERDDRRPVRQLAFAKTARDAGRILAKWASPPMPIDRAP
jgi:hypothetical protein